MKKNSVTKLYFIFFGFFLAMTLALVGNVSSATQMPRFSLKSVVDGKKVDSNKFQNQVVLITFFATWCPPCIEEIPSLIKLQDEFAEQGFSVVAVSVDQGGAKSVKKMVDKTGINYPVLLADSKITRDFGNIVGIPTSFLVNRKGKVIKNYPGYVGHGVFAADIKQLMP